MKFIHRLFKAIKALIIGHFTVFKHIFKKKVTLEYPEKRPNLGEHFRGKHILDRTKCTGCGMCQTVCPAGAIQITKDKGEDGKLFVKDYTVDLKKCIFCGNCQYYCPQKAISLSDEFELATDDKHSLILHLIDNSSCIINEEGKSNA